eukprot:UC4_evm3s594
MSQSSLKLAEQADAAPAMFSQDTRAADNVTTTNFWFEEFLSDDHKLTMRLKKIFFAAKSKYQKVEIIETVPFGKTLVMDGKTQSCSLDEFIYHETLVHPALCCKETPAKTVYVAGGGEGATVREVLRHKSVEKCVMVDIDGVAVEQCIEHLPEWFDGSHRDSRLELHYDDAKSFLERYDGKFDVIIMDICDPIEAGPGIALYTKEFYDFAIKKLNPGGVLVTQSGSCAFFNCEQCFTTIHQTLGQCFKKVNGYNTEIPSFGSSWGFNLAYDSGSDFSCLSPEIIDERINDRVGSNVLRHYDGLTHRGMFSLTKPIREAMAREQRCITVDTPVFMY